MTATAHGTLVILAWRPPSGPVTGYDYSKDNGAWTAIGNSARSRSHEHEVTGLTPGSTYAFRVRKVRASPDW